MRTKKTYDVFFQDETSSNNKGFRISYKDCRAYIDTNINRKGSLFDDYQGGTVEIVCNETEEVVFRKQI